MGKAANRTLHHIARHGRGRLLDNLARSILVGLLGPRRRYRLALGRVAALLRGRVLTAGRPVTLLRRQGRPLGKYNPRHQPVEDAVGKARRYGLLSRKPAAPAVVLGHKRRVELLPAARTLGVELRQTYVGLVQQLRTRGQSLGIALDRTLRIVDQVEGVRRDLAAALVRSLRYDRRGRSRIAVAACGDTRPERPQRLVYEQRVVHVASRRADVHYYGRRRYLRYARHLAAELLVGRHPALIAAELPLLGYAYRALDVDVTRLGFVSDCDFRLHRFLFRFLWN